MDFKVAGTKDGVTALQMDIKVKALQLKLWNLLWKKQKMQEWFLKK